MVVGIRALDWGSDESNWKQGKAKLKFVGWLRISDLRKRERANSAKSIAVMAREGR